MSQDPALPDIVIEDCWNHIGVWGTETPRCARLADVIHCRNCEVFSAAGRRVLERRLPEEYEIEWSEAYAEQKKQDISVTESVTVFRLGEEWMALPTAAIDQITNVCAVHSIPHRPNPVLRGLVNLHGQLQICVSLGHLMEIEKGMAYNEQIDKQRYYPRMVVMQDRGRRYVFTVSEVKGTCRYNPAQLKDAPATVSQATGTYTQGIIEWEGHDVACLDAELLIYSLDKHLA